MVRLASTGSRIHQTMTPEKNSAEILFDQLQKDVDENCWCRSDNGYEYNCLGVCPDTPCECNRASRGYRKDEPTGPDCIWPGHGLVRRSVAKSASLLKGEYKPRADGLISLKDIMESGQKISSAIAKLNKIADDLRDVKRS